MGKKKRLNRLISRWIKSDLPEDSSSPTVLLLGVTRIPTSPTPARRPRSLALIPNHNHFQPASNAPSQRPISVIHPYAINSHHRNLRASSPAAPVERNCIVVDDDHVLNCCTFSRTSACAAVATDFESEVGKAPTHYDSPLAYSAQTKVVSPSDNTMDRSVDSIGTCSLDVDASAELLSDYSENPSVDTLRSASIKSLTPQQEHRLPSYLSLACTVNGYSQITNYDPIRLAKSRDSSPHRPIIDNEQLTYAIQNNLLSPPNLVPLPTTVSRFHSASIATGVTKQPSTMSDHTATFAHHHEEFYTKKMTFITKDTTYKYNSYISDSVDRVDACIDAKKYNGHANAKSINVDKCKNGDFGLNGHHATNGEPKSFIQQRVERLYGPGALAQGFFVTKRQKSRNSESDANGASHLNVSASSDKHSKSMCDKLLIDDDADATMKQSASSPSLPVMRHLTPEFRAQLPTFSPRRGVDTILQKSTTLPQLKDNASIPTAVKVVTMNGTHDKVAQSENNNCLNGSAISPIKSSTVEESSTTIAANSDVKDGHYFLNILQNEADRLLALAAKAEQELDLHDHELNEDAKGFLRSAAGKARLLVSQKMQQFKGLCANNITQAEGDAFPTTNQDLQGFWDMVMLQVDQIDSLFKDLDEMRDNNWQEVVKKSVDAVDKPTNGKSRTKLTAGPRARTAGAEEARLKREALRKQMVEDRRRALREAKATQQAKSIEIFVPESS